MPSHYLIIALSWIRIQDSYTSWLIETFQSGYVSDLYSIICIMQRKEFIQFSKENILA